MIFKLRIVFLGLISIFYFSSILLAVEIFPLPIDVVKISEETSGSGMMKVFVNTYQSFLNKNKLVEFYKKELTAAGWEENRKGHFSKGSNMLIIMVSPAKDKIGKTSFVISAGKYPTMEEISAMRKKDPDKLNFMPIYPGSEQIFLSDLPNGLSALYETEDNIRDVAFFYKSGMLNYGWSLAAEEPIKSAPIDCVECEKSFMDKFKVAKLNSLGTSSQATLIFRKGTDETCKIIILNVNIDIKDPVEKTQVGSIEKAVLLPSSSNKTSISVLYDTYKKISK